MTEDKEKEALEYLKKMWRYIDSLHLPKESSDFIKKHPFMLPNNWEELLKQREASDDRG